MAQARKLEERLSWVVVPDGLFGDLTIWAHHLVSWPGNPQSPRTPSPNPDPEDLASALKCLESLCIVCVSSFVGLFVRLFLF